MRYQKREFWTLDSDMTESNLKMKTKTFLSEEPGHQKCWHWENQL